MNDLYDFVNFTIDNLNINSSYVWFNDSDYITDINPYIIIDGVSVYYFDNTFNFDAFSYDVILCSYIVFSIPGKHYILYLHQGIDFIRFFDYMIGYLGYNELIHYK